MHMENTLIFIWTATFIVGFFSWQVRVWDIANVRSQIFFNPITVLLPHFEVNCVMLDQITLVRRRSANMQCRINSVCYFQILCIIQPANSCQSGSVVPKVSHAGWLLVSPWLGFVPTNTQGIFCTHNVEVTQYLAKLCECTHSHHRHSLPIGQVGMCPKERNFIQRKGLCIVLVILQRTNGCVITVQASPTTYEHSALNATYTLLNTPSGPIRSCQPRQTWGDT